MLKGYVRFLQLVKDGEEFREDVSFDSRPKNAMYWRNVVDADIKCQELNRGVRIPSSKGGNYLLTDFKTEQIEPGRFSIWCEGPFILRAAN